MPENKTPAIDTCGETYRLIRVATERVVNELLAAMRDKREGEVVAHLRERRSSIERRVGKPLSDADLATVMEIRMSHSSGFAHALLQGAVEAFDDQKAGFQLLKRLIEVELADMDAEANLVHQATCPGSRAIN